MDAEINKSVPWTQLADEKRHQLLDLIPEKWKLSPEIINDKSIKNAVEFIDEKCSVEENKITNSCMNQLIDKLVSGRYTSTELLSAFAKRACYSHQLLNCLSEIFLEKAFERAKELDEYFKRTGQLIGPLHGIPISLKDNFNVENVRTTYGISRRALSDPIAIDDQTELVTMLLDMGAILFVKTTIPFAVAGFETNSNLFGYTKNAVDREFSAGGSSGGEGALVACKGSVVGFGTDLCGSVRQPAAFEGIYGFKPTSSRFPVGEIRDGSYQFRNFPNSVGVLARRLEDIEMISRLVIDQCPWKFDPNASLQPWNKIPALNKPLKIGILPFDGNCMPTPPITRALKEIEKSLKKTGHKVFIWEFTSDDTNIQKIGNTIVGADGGDFVHGIAQWSKEPIPTTVGGYSSLPANPQPMKATEMGKLNIEIYKAKKRWLKYWKENEADVLICPTVERNAVKPEKFYDDNPQSYTILANVLDYPAISIPVGFADRIKDKDWQYKPQSDDSYDGKNYKLYDADEIDSMPIAVQVIAPRLQEEKLLHAVKIIEKSLKEGQNA